MIDDSELVFPDNAVQLMYDRFVMVDSDLMVVRRPLRSSDNTQSVGVYPITWSPVQPSQEIGKTSPTLARYNIGVQGFIQDTNEEQGIRVHSRLSKIIRSILYDDIALRVGLGHLAITMNGKTERFQNIGITVQRYLSTEVSGTWMYLSTIEAWIETETT